MTITPEERHEIDQAGAVCIEDAETHAAYVILKAEVYERIKSLIRNVRNGHEEIAEGIRRSQDAFFSDLPKLLEDKICWTNPLPIAGTNGSGSPHRRKHSSERSTAVESRTTSSTCL
jgi:hypothetical protein